MRMEIKLLEKNNIGQFIRTVPYTGLLLTLAGII